MPTSTATSAVDLYSDASASPEATVRRAMSAPVMPVAAPTTHITYPEADILRTGVKELHAKSESLRHENAALQEQVTALQTELQRLPRKPPPRRWSPRCSDRRR
jgi:hypothetical protein